LGEFAEIVLAERADTMEKTAQILDLGFWDRNAKSKIQNRK